MLLPPPLLRSTPRTDMAVRPLTPLRPTPQRGFGPSPREGGGLSRQPPRPSDSGRNAGRPPSGPPRPFPTPTTPPQPGAPPQPPLPPLPAIPIIGGLLLGGLWGALNWRPPKIIDPLPDGTRRRIRPTNGFIRVRSTVQSNITERTTCPPGAPLNDVIGAVNEVDWGLFQGTDFLLGRTVLEQRTVCTPGVNTPNNQAPIFTIFRQDGTISDSRQGSSGGVATALNGTRTRTVYGNWRVSPHPGPDLPFVSERDGEFAPKTKPLAPVPLPLTEPAPLPLPRPAPRPLRPTEPERPLQPEPAEPQPGPATPPAPRPRPPVAPAIPASPAPGRGPGRGPLVGSPVTASGPETPPEPAPPVTPKDSTFLPGGVELPNRGPAPTPQNIATELGKIERKLEIMLDPKEALSPLDLLNRVIDQVENIEFLIERLFPPEPYTFPDGEFTLTPSCPSAPGAGEPEPRRAPWAGGEGELLEISRKINALAELIQHHKDLKQPTCGGRNAGPGSNVTLHFESD